MELKAAEEVALRSSGSSSSVGPWVAILILVPEFAVLTILVQVESIQ